MTAARSATLVGREGEIQQLEAAVRAARQKQGTVLLVEGEAGIGKSRLLSEASARFAAPGDIVVRGQAVELAGGDVPYGVVADMLRDLRRVHAGVGRTLEPAVRKSLNDLLTTLTGGEAPRVDRGLLLDSFVTLVETLGHGRLVWWVVEDLHWADASSRDVLHYLIRALGPAQVLITMTIRTGEAWRAALSEFVVEAVRSPRVKRLRLMPLHNGEVEDHVRQLAGGSVSTAVLERVRRLGEGIPFWTEELVLGGLGEGGRVPESVRGLIETRLVRLGGTARRLVEAVSVVDRADHTMLSGVCGLDEEELELACNEAVTHQVLVVSEDGSGYQFRHALLREAVAESLLPGRRRRLHREWAEELDRAAHDGALSQFRIEAAHHWARAGDPRRALTAAYAAARLAEQASGQHEEARLLARMLHHWSEVPDAEALLGVSRSTIVVRCVAALFGSGQYEECLAVLDAELSSTQGRVAELYLRLRRHVVLEELARENEDDTAVEGLRDHAEELLRSPLDDPWTSPALVMCAYYLSDEDAAIAVRLCERAVDAARSRGDLRAELHAVDSMAWSLANLGDVEGAITTLGDGVQAARDVDPAWASMLEGSLAWYLWSQGRYRPAVETARSALRYIRRPQAAPERVAWIAESEAEALISMGEWDQASRVLDEAVALSPSGQAAVTLHCLTGLLAVRRGDVEAGRRHLEVARRHTPPQEDALLSQRLPPRWLAAELAASDQDLDGVRAALGPLWEAPHPEVVSESLWRPMLLLARVEADEASQPDHARDPRLGETRGAEWTSLQALADQLHRLGPVGDAWRRQLEAERERADGKVDPATWQGVADDWAELGQPHEQATALLHVAAGRLAIGDRDMAAATLEVAGEVADRLGAVPLAQALDRLARRSRLTRPSSLPRQRGAAEPSFERLTPREHEVLTLVARGLDNAGVASELFISAKTASVHVSRILAKLGVTSRTQAASLAYRHGLVQPDPPD